LSIESLVSPIVSSKNYLTQEKICKEKKEKLEAIVEISENNENNLKEDKIHFEGIEKISHLYKGNTNTNELSLLKEFNMSSVNCDNTLNLQENEVYEETIIKNRLPVTERTTISRPKENKPPILSKVRFKDESRLAPSKQSNIVCKYRHLFEDVEENSNPISGRARYASVKKTFKNDFDVESDFTSFRNNGNNTYVFTEISLDKINLNSKMNFDAVQEGSPINIAANFTLGRKNSITPKVQHYTKSSMFRNDRFVKKSMTPSLVESNMIID
jgi:hypothetical protein